MAINNIQRGHRAKSVIVGQSSAVYINFYNPELKENILTGLCIDIDIKKMACCIVCKRSLPKEASDDEMIICNNRKIK